MEQKDRLPLLSQILESHTFRYPKNQQQVDWQYVLNEENRPQIVDFFPMHLLSDLRLGHTGVVWQRGEGVNRLHGELRPLEVSDLFWNMVEERSVYKAYRSYAHPTYVQVVLSLIQSILDQPAEVVAAWDTHEQTGMHASCFILATRASITLGFRVSQLVIPEDILGGMFSDEKFSVNIWAGSMSPGKDNFGRGRHIVNQVLKRIDT